MNKADLLAVVDVIADVSEVSDSLDVESAVALREGLAEVMTAVKDATALIDAQLVKTLESPRVMGGLLYEVKNSDGKWRPDHHAVKALVKKRAVADENGEVRSAHDAVEVAMDLLYRLYVSPSTMPKTGPIEELGKKKWDVARQEPGSKKLVVKPSTEPDT